MCSGRGGQDLRGEASGESRHPQNLAGENRGLGRVKEGRRGVPGPQVDPSVRSDGPQLSASLMTGQKQKKREESGGWISGLLLISWVALGKLLPLSGLIHL